MDKSWFFSSEDSEENSEFGVLGEIIKIANAGICWTMFDFNDAFWCLIGKGWFLITNFGV